MDRSADRDVKIKLQFVRGQLEKGRIIQVYVMDTGRIGALTSPQYFSHAMQTYFPHAVCAEPDSKAPRASSIMARIREGVTDLATVAVVQGATWPWGVRYRAPLLAIPHSRVQVQRGHKAKAQVDQPPRPYSARHSLLGQVSRRLKRQGLLSLLRDDVRHGYSVILRVPYDRP